ncbi:MAG TPA: alpha/beta hydrolase-fold protein, partial [Polyangiaceae bacterium]|nr:alpha/beta hydrolase-fold protein [Polyangiaceae bacterium]
EPWLFGRDCCGLEGYVGYLADSVKGWVDANYRTRPGPESTAIVGSSHGGLAAFYTAAARPDRFGLAGCLSSSFWAGLDPGFLFGGEALRDSRLLARARPTLAGPAGRPRRWRDWGLVRSGGEHNSLVEAMATTRGREMAALLRDEYGYGPGELATREDPQGGHDEDSWGRRFPDVMRFLFGAP